MPRPPRDLTGHRSGRLVAKERLSRRSDNGKVLWRCKCDCGGEKVVPANSLGQKIVRSCGCLRQDLDKRVYDYGKIRHRP